MILLYCNCALNTFSIVDTYIVRVYKISIDIVRQVSVRYQPLQRSRYIIIVHYVYTGMCQMLIFIMFIRRESPNRTDQKKKNKQTNTSE